MAQLKDLIVSGPTRLVGDATANNIQITSIKAHSAANSTTFGPGTADQVLTSDGTALYWRSPSDWGYVKTNDITKVMQYQGTKATKNALPTDGNTIGDVWHINADGSEYAWDGSQWQELGTAIDLSNYALKSDIPTISYPVTSVNNKTGAVSLTYTDVNAASSSHAHGNITNSGDITAAAPTIANGDQLVINDNSASKITNGPTFDGSTTTTALTPKGTWETFSKFSGSYNDLTNKPTIPTLPSNIVNTITTTAGTHTEITSQKGDVSFNVPTKTSHLDNDSGFVTSSGVTSITTESPISGGTITGTGTISHATSGVGTAITTPGFYKFKYDTYGHVTGVSSVTASDITGLVTIPTNTDEKVKSTTVTAATTNYIVGSTTSTTTTGGLSKHASALIYTSANIAENGYTQLRLGNATATSTAGGKEGCIRLYGTSTHYLDLKAGAITSSNKTITFPDQTGTVFLQQNIIRSTADPTDASSYPVGTIWIKYGADPMATMGDYITDTGTSGIWTYRKWNSGIAECWGLAEISGLSWVDYTTGGTPTCFSSPAAQVPMPASLFTSITSINANTVSAGSNVGWVANTTFSNNNVQLIFVRNGTAGVVRAYIDIKGRWKE